MRHGKPKRMERGSEAGSASPDETAPPIAAPEIAPPTEPAAPIALAPPAPVIEPAPEIMSVAPQPRADSLEDPWTAVAQTHSVLTRGLEEFAAEVSGMSRSGIAAAAEAAGALLGATTFSEAVEINAALARRSTDVMIEGAAKLAEIGVRALSELSQPILSRSGALWRGEVAPG